MLKSEARKEFRSRRSELSKKEKSRLDNLLLIEFQKVKLPFVHYLLSYWPIEDYNEPNTHLFTDYVEFKNPHLLVCYPKIESAAFSMQAISAPEGSLFIKNKFDIPEPRNGEVIDPSLIDMVFVPLVVFDRKGNRAGYGKGYYDRFLMTCRPDCLKIGFSYFEPVELLEDKNQYDIPLNMCITPAGSYVF